MPLPEDDEDFFDGTDISKANDNIVWRLPSWNIIHKILINPHIRKIKLIDIVPEFLRRPKTLDMMLEIEKLYRRSNERN